MTDLAVDLLHLRFSYPSEPESPVLDIPSWGLDKGEQAFIYGPSGCGKSTLLSLISGMLDCPQGQVAVLGTDISKLSNRQRDRFRAQNIGYVFQQFNLIPYLNAVDNIRLAAQFSNKKQQSNLQSDINSLLRSLNISENDSLKPTRLLSIGQQQRVAIARALINKPQLLIADEPTSSLDQDNRDAFVHLLMAMAQENNITLLFVSHDMSLATHFNRVESLSDINAASPNKEAN